MKNTVSEIIKQKVSLDRDFEKIIAVTTQKKIRPFEDKFASPEYLELVRKTNEETEAMLKSYYEHDLNLHGPDHFSRENVYVWGGPTPSWGGSMEKDASIKAKEYFGVDNVMYVYGPINDEMLTIHRECRKVICHLGRNCRTEGAAMQSDAEEAETLSRMSLKYPNIVGGVVDDMIGNYGTNYSRREYQAIYDGLHKHNPDLELYGVVYSWELDQVNVIKALSECIDHIILWFWKKTALTELDLAVEKCRCLFPGKPIMVGIFMFDYGLSCLPNTPDTMRYHLEKARRLLAAGKIQDMVILGDREVEKCPEAAVCIRDFLGKEFAYGNS